MNPAEKARVLAWLDSPGTKDGFLRTIGGGLPNDRVSDILPMDKIREHVEAETVLGLKLAKAVLLTIAQEESAS